VDIGEATAATADVFGNLTQSGFSLPDATAAWFAALVGRPGWLAYIASVEGEGVGAAAMYVKGGAAWCGIDATLPSYRRQGVQRALIHRRVEDAQRSGLSIVTAETSYPSNSEQADAASYRNYGRANFKMVYARPNFRFSTASLATS